MSEETKMMSALDIFAQTQETFDDAKKKSNEESGNKVKYFRISNDGDYSVRILPLAPVIDADGNVYVDGELLDEPYLTEKALGDCDIALPYQVLDNRYFCMGDHRSTSVDSRSTTVGCVSGEQIVGKIVFRVWPIADFGILK